MSNKEYVLALDAGTSSVRAILFRESGEIASIAQKEFRQIYPKPSWVEHDAMEIWNSQVAVIHEALSNINAKPTNIAALGITNQRETIVLWDKATGSPLHNALVWQDRRTADSCDQLKQQGLEDYVKNTTGLVIDSYFSGTKIAWLLDNISGARTRAERGELAVGTIDSWLIYKLSGGKLHVTDVSNASRTLLFDINCCKWDEKLLNYLCIPNQILPTIQDSSQVYGETTKEIFDGHCIPIASAVGDQQGALFGQSCFEPGMVKSTYGTGGSLMMNVGHKPKFSNNGLLTTVAWRIGGKVEYALEGLLFSLGSVIQWLRDELRIISSAQESEIYASQVDNTQGVYFVPAFTGLSAPYWDQYARGTLVGITRGSGRNHIIRASIESMAYQIRDVISCMEADSGINLTDLKVDGGAAMNNFLLQFQSDLLGVKVLRPKVIDSSARGAAFLAGLATGFWRDKKSLNHAFSLDKEFNPVMAKAYADQLYSGWKRAVERSSNWQEKG